MGIEKLFDEKTARKNLKRYLQKGPRRPTRLLIEAIKANSPSGSLLDIGGGVGIIQLELLSEGVQKVTDVDASNGYIKVAKEEAIKRGYEKSISYMHEDFTNISTVIDSHNIVTLDKVICCYPEMQDLVKSSSEKAKELYGLVYPRENILSKLLVGFGNLFIKLFNRNFKSYIHSNTDVRAILDENFKEIYYKTTGIWQVVLFRRNQH